MIEWTSQVKSGELRCPYCVVDGSFRLMTHQSGGDWYFCDGCGHLALRRLRSITARAANARRSILPSRRNLLPGKFNLA